MSAHTVSVFVPERPGSGHYVGPIQAIQDAESELLALIGAGFEDWPIVDRTVISATLGDGRRGWCVGIVFDLPLVRP